jgi:hypothetical protein
MNDRITAIIALDVLEDEIAAYEHAAEEPPKRHRPARRGWGRGWGRGEAEKGFERVSIARVLLSYEASALYYKRILLSVQVSCHKSW